MSEPVTNVEIEDVLSSIRRLVSGDVQQAQRAAQRTEDEADEPGKTALNPVDSRAEEGASEPLQLGGDLLAETETETVQASEPETSAEPEASSALILTAALRVSEEDASQEQETVDAVVQEPDPEEAQIDEKVAQSAAAEDDATEAQKQAEEAEAVDEAIEVSAQEEPRAQEAEPEEDEPEAEPEKESAAEAVDEPQSEAEAPIEADAQEEAEPEAQSTLEDVEDTPEYFTQERQDRSIEDKIAALEALIGRSQNDQDFVPDGETEAQDAPFESARLPWSTETPGASQLPDPDAASQSTEFNASDAAFAAAHLAAAQQAQDDLTQVATQTLDSGFDSAPMIDEEALRDMVAEIVRQELQGPLGERITRNVRKLVRREIYRAMAANELD